MRIVSSYKVEIVHQRSLLKKTMEISRAASAWLDPAGRNDALMPREDRYAFLRLLNQICEVP